MAVTQISRVQHRRGLQQDLPQLASAELGWSLDQRRLFIGNGTTAEGSPTEGGVTEILTQYTDILSVLQTYTFRGNSAGYTVQTGTNPLTPVARAFQAKLDDFVNIEQNNLAPFQNMHSGIDFAKPVLSATSDRSHTEINPFRNNLEQTLLTRPAIITNHD